MTPTDFMLVADRLFALGNEAAHRSAVSRAYYAAFHAARELLEGCGVRFPKVASAHEHVSFCLDESGVNEFVQSSRTLRSLRTARNEADYDFSKQQFRNPMLVKLHLEEARKLLQLYDLNRSAEIATTVRKYAAKTLGLVVS